MPLPAVLSCQIPLVVHKPNKKAGRLSTDSRPVQRAIACSLVDNLIIPRCLFPMQVHGSNNREKSRFERQGQIQPETQKHAFRAVFCLRLRGAQGRNQSFGPPGKIADAKSRRDKPVHGGNQARRNRALHGAGQIVLEARAMRWEYPGGILSQFSFLRPTKGRWIY